MPGEDTTLKIILEDQGGQQQAPQGPGPGGQPLRPGDRSDFERVMFKGEIPPPPPPPGTVGPKVPGPSDSITGQLGGLSQALTDLTSTVQETITDQSKVPPPAPPPVAGSIPPPEPPPIQQPPSPSGLLAGLARSSAAPSFAAGIATRATGSATVGGLVGTGTGALLTGLSATGVGIPIAAAVAGITIAGTALVESFNAISNEADRLTSNIRHVSPDIMQAEAFSDIRRLMHQFEIAQRIGPELAGVVTAKSDLEISTEELKVAVLEEFLPLLVTGVEMLTTMVDLTKLLVLFAKENKDWGKAVLEGIMGAVFPKLAAGIDILDLLAIENKKLRELLGGDKEAERSQLMNLFNEFFQPIGGVDRNPVNWPQPGGGF